MSQPGSEFLDNVPAGLIELNPEQVLSNRKVIVSVYELAFRPRPYEKSFLEVHEFAKGLRSSCLRDGFRFIAGMNQDSGRMAGFAFGYQLTRDQWWYQVVAPRMPPELRAAWMEDSFKFAEIAVAPDFQGRGLGGRLHDMLLRAVAPSKAVLSTLHGETAAARLYRARGWQLLLEGITFPGVAKKYNILGYARFNRPPD